MNPNFHLPLSSNRSLAPWDLQKISPKTINWDDFHDPVDDFQESSNGWKGYRLQKIDPFDLTMVRKIYFAYNPEVDNEWLLIFDRIDGVAVYLNACCCSSGGGFGCWSDGELSYSDDFETFWNRCLDENGRMHMIREFNEATHRNNNRTT